MSNNLCRTMIYTEVGRDHRYHTYINLKLPTLFGRCCYKEYLKWERTVESVFGCNSYSERDKVKFATSAFDDEALNWWDDLEDCRQYYGERSISTWLDMKIVMRERFCQNGYKEVLLQDHDNSGRETRVDRINKGVAELREGMEKIESLFSQWKESSLNLNKACNNNVKSLTTKG